MPHQPKGGNGVSGRIRFIRATCPDKVREDEKRKAGVLRALLIDMSMQMS